MTTENKLRKYTWKDALIPFSWACKKYRKSDEESSLREKLYTAFNSGIYSLIGFSLIIYSMASIENGSLNYKKWPEIREERVLQQKLDHQNFYREQFQKLDSDFNGVIDSTEFIYREGNKK